MKTRSIESTVRPAVLGVAIALISLAVALPIGAVVEPQDGHLAAKEFLHRDLEFESAATHLIATKAETAAQPSDALDRMGIGEMGAQIDSRGGRFETLLPSHLLIEAETALGQGREQRATAARVAFTAFLETFREELQVETHELGTGRVTVHGDGTLIQVYLPREIRGIEVRGSYVGGVINHGKLNLFGIHRWGDVDISLEPTLTAGDAAGIVGAHLAPYSVAGTWSEDRLLLLPTDRGGSYGHRLAWAIHPKLMAEHASFEVLVDAHTGELLSVQDTNHYAEAKGGVYPVTNDGIAPDGVEQPGWPMPFMEVGSQITDTGGNYTLTGSQTARLRGPFVDMADQCGPESLTQSGGIDWGTSGGDDCTTPGFGGAGNTHASRSGFYELNRTKEMARGWLPSNGWLQNRLTANMNINSTCNAFWNGFTVNFYRSGGGCSNTGEIAGVFVHEWGHGMDANDTVPGIASPSGEGIADIYTALRLNTSCIGRNFRSTPCSGFGDPCLTCTGVRDIDYQKRLSGQPHDYSWSNANCGSSVHCIGAVYAEAVWSLWKRNLQQAPYNYDNNTAHEIVNRLTFLGAGNVGTWFSGGPPFGGCSSSGGYLNYLAADDDDGNLSNGTPHMQAIFDAFNDQEIACQTPIVQDSGCAGVPTTTPNVNATAGDQQVGLSWNPVAGATSYEVFRAEGIFGCDFGKVRVGSTGGTSFTDSGLQNGRDYSYVVIPKRGASCFGPASACDTVQPSESGGCSVNADCDDGTFCNGAETCNAGTCQPGTTPACDDGDFCNGVETCNEATDSCDSGSDPCNGGTCDETNDQCVECTTNADCNDGAFCNGVETCNAGSCVAGTPVVCSDGAFCNGVESCNEATDSCVPGTPVLCNDGVSCTVDSCNENTNSCSNVALDSLCDDGAFCNGAETCDPIDDCQVGTPPCAGDQTCDEAGDVCEGGSNPRLWMSFRSSTAVPGVGTVADEDVVSYDELTGTWALEFDGSDVGLASREISGLAILPDGDLLLSFTSGGTAGGVSFDDSDIVRFTPTSLGPFTSGTFSLYFDGSDVALTSSSEDVDGMTLAADGRLIISTNGNFSGFGASGLDEDLFIFTGTLGSSTSGTFALYFDGSDVGLGNSSNEDIDGVTLTRGGTLLLSTIGSFSVPGLFGADEDVAEFTGSFGSTTSGTYTLRQDLSSLGISTGEDVGSLALASGGGGGGGECSVDADCNDGAFCNGTETCNAGTCVGGTPVSCNDGVSCTSDSCNEVVDSCVHLPLDSVCSDGAFCNGTETCDPINDCRVGTPPCGNGQTCDETTDTCDGGGQSTLWMSFESDTTVPGVGRVRDEDIVAYDELTGTWTLKFDGSDVGLAGEEISGLAVLPGGDLLLSFSSSGNVGGVVFDDSDIVRFTPTFLGPFTSGTFSLYFDGSDVALTSSSEDVDSIALASDGRLIISTTGNFSGFGASGVDEDLFIFTGTLGSNTSGSFRLHFDGSDVGLGNGGEDVDAAAFTGAGTLLYSTDDSFSVPGLSGADEDIVEFSGTFGSVTSGSHSMRQDLTLRGISSGENVRSLFIVE